MKIESKRAYCRIPWTSIALLPNGDVMPCVACNSLYPESIWGNLKKQTFSDIWTGEVAQAFRKTHLGDLRGFRPCQICHHVEKQGKLNRRDEMEAKYAQLFDQWTSPDQQVTNPEQITLLDMAFSSACNLTCTMCSSKYSTSWIDLEERLSSQGFSRSHKPTPKGGYERFEENLSSIFPYLQNLNFLLLKGGEPLMSKECLWFLNQLVDRGISKNVTLIIITNGTIFNNQIAHLFENFKKIEAVVSLDGVGPIYNYIRGGDRVTFEDVVENMVRYRKVGDHVRVVASPTLMAYNALQFFDLIKASFEISHEVSFKNWVIEPVYQSIAALPHSLMSKVVDQLWQSKLFLAEHYLTNRSAPFLDYVMDYASGRVERFPIHAEDKEITQKFIRYTKIMNDYRNLEFHELQPEFAEFF